eukprot:ctg_4292.g517
MAGSPAGDAANGARNSATREPPDRRRRESRNRDAARRLAVREAVQPTGTRWVAGACLPHHGVGGAAGTQVTGVVADTTAAAAAGTAWDESVTAAVHSDDEQASELVCPASDGDGSAHPLVPGTGHDGRLASSSRTVRWQRCRARRGGRPVWPGTCLGRYDARVSQWQRPYGIVAVGAGGSAATLERAGRPRAHCAHGGSATRPRAGL